MSYGPEETEPITRRRFGEIWDYAGLGLVRVVTNWSANPSARAEISASATVPYLLPENYRFRAIVSAVDTSCSLAVAGNKSIMTV